MCTVLLPPGVIPIAVNYIKHIISYIKKGGQWTSATLLSDEELGVNVYFSRKNTEKISNRQWYVLLQDTTAC